MNQALQMITDWPERTGCALWCIDTLAKNCGVSVSTLERFFHATHDQCPHAWMNAERMRRARELLERPERIKHITTLLGYEHAQNFCSAFTKFHGYSPKEHLHRESRVQNSRPNAHQPDTARVSLSPRPQRPDKT